MRASARSWLALASMAIVLAGCPRAPTAIAPSERPRDAVEGAVAAADGPSTLASSESAPVAAGLGPGFARPGPWLTFYGTAAQMGDLARAARTFRILDVDADPGSRNFTDQELRELKAGGTNRVLSYLNIGSCEHFRTYWSFAPPPFQSCRENRAAQRGPYEGYADETWMDPSNEDYASLVVDFVAARLAARGVDGFYLDNLELIEHSEHDANGPCSPRCRQGALDLVRRLRERFPAMLLVMQNATGDAARLGTTGGTSFPRLLDGIAHEEVFAPRSDPDAERELLAWRELGIRTRGGYPFFVGTVDYVGNCTNTAAARAAYVRSRNHGFSPYASDRSSGQKVVCYWRF